jgi:hypothetical protein
MTPTLATLPAEPPVQALATPTQATMPDVEPMDKGRSRRAEVQNYLNIREIQRWGNLDTDQRPAAPWRNEHGFSQGDRWHWTVTDTWRKEVVDTVFLRLDGINVVGRLIGHDGHAMFEGRGDFIALPKARGLPDERWVWPLRVADMVDLPEGSSREVEAVLDIGDNTRINFSGTAHRRGVQRLKVQAGDFDVVRIDVRVMSRGGRVTREISFWYAAGLGLPVAWEQDHRINGRLEHRLRMELTAYDVQAANTRMADLSAGL